MWHPSHVCCEYGATGKKGCAVNPYLSTPGHGPREVHAPRGTTLNAKSWQTEAPLRMLMNNLDPEVAEKPDELVIYGGTGRAARSWEAFDMIVETLKELEDDETLLIQSGKPVGVLKTNEWAPRVLIANSNLVGDWATWEEFRHLEDEGLIMYGQMTAGSWIYIATQGILQGTFETFAAIARKRFGGTLAGTISLTGGCGGMGGAQPLAVTLNGGVVIIADVDRGRLERRQSKRYLDTIAESIDDAVAQANKAKEEKRALSIGLEINASELFPEMLRRHRAGEIHIDIVTDQTSAHDPLSYLPQEIPFDRWHTEAADDPQTFTKKARECPWPRRYRRWLSSRTRVPRCLTTATPSATRPARPATTGRLSSRVLFPPTSGPCSARATAPSGGRRCRATRKISRSPMMPCASCSPKTSISSAGSTRPRSMSSLKASQPVSAG